MEIFKKILSFVLVAVITAGVAISGTVAYLQSEDSDVNVMTLGNVKIAQHEYERILKEDGTYEMVTSEKYGEGYKLQEFTQAKPLYPATGEITGWGTIVPFDQIEGASGAQSVFAGLNNVQDKFVLVENTGKSDAYVRTIIALEYGSNTKDIIGISTGDFWDWTEIGVVEIDGNNYYVYEAIYKGSDTRHTDGILPAGEYTYNSLGQIYLANEATNEDCEALDGNGNGTYDILVLSQAVQTAGFDDAATALDAAFGEADATNVAAWFSGEEFETPVVVTTAEELLAALEEGKKVLLGNDIALTEAVSVEKTANINLGGYTLTTMGLDLTQGGTVEDGTITSGGDTNLTPHFKVSGGSIVMDNVTVVVNHPLNANAYWTEATGMEVANATAVLNNCNISIDNQKKAQWVYSYGISLNNAEITVNGGSITAKCIEGTAANGPTNPNAISTMGACTATLNNVAVDATYYATTVNGHLTLNTTDKNITNANVVDNRGGSHTINYI